MIVSRDVCDLYYEDPSRDEGQSTTIVFLNGFGSGISIWYPIIRRLKRHYRCILYDYPGSGKSSSGPGYQFTLETYCEDLKQLLAELGVETTHLVGYSMGGWIAQHFYSLYRERVRSLVLVNSSSRIFARQNWIISHFIDVLQDSDIDVFSRLMFISYYSPEFFEGNYENLERIKTLATVTFDQHSRTNWRSLLESCLAFDAEAALAETDTPILLVSGRHDFLCPPMTAKRFREVVPMVHWHELESVGHAIPMEEPRALRELTEGFFDAQKPVPRALSSAS